MGTEAQKAHEACTEVYMTGLIVISMVLLVASCGGLLMILLWLRCREDTKP